MSTDGRTTVFQPATDGTDLVAGFTTFAAPNRGGVVAIDPVTGNERWRATFPNAPRPITWHGLNGESDFAGDVVIASSGDGTVYGFDRAKGFIRWAIPPIPGLPPILQGPFPLPDTSGADYRPLARTWRTLFVGLLKGPVIAYDLETFEGDNGGTTDPQRFRVFWIGQRQSLCLRSLRIRPTCRAGPK